MYIPHFLNLFTYQQTFVSTFLTIVKNDTMDMKQQVLARMWRNLNPSHCQGNVKWSSHYGKILQRFLKKLVGESNGTPLQYSCLKNPMDGGAWQAAVRGVAKSRTPLNVLTFTFHFHALEKEMATHSSVLAWRIPGMGSHRVRHD